MTLRQFRSVILIGCLVFPRLAFAETQWMGQINQWAVGFESGSGEPYCRLVWDSLLGRTVEFQARRDGTRWLVARDGWAIPPGTVTTVTIVDGQRNIAAPAIYADPKTLQLWSKQGHTSDGPTKRLITEAFAGRPDVQLTFSGNEPAWTVPMSRVQTLYPEFLQCMQRLNGKSLQTAEAGSAQPF